MHGVKRVIAFCICIVILPATLIIIPLYLRHSVFADVTYPVAESDIIEIRDGISSIFCEQHSLHMNTTFNAFQLQSKPEISRNRKHIRLKKSMTLPDDTLEYWGFYLLKGAIVELKVCSRYDGSRILLVKGDRNLNTCGLLEHNKNKFGAHFAHGYDKVQVTFETAAEVVVSEEEKFNKNTNHNYNITNKNDDLNNQKNNETNQYHHNYHHYHQQETKHHSKYHHDKISTEEIRNIGGDYQNDDSDIDENHGGEDFTEIEDDNENQIVNKFKKKIDNIHNDENNSNLKTENISSNINDKSDLIKNSINLITDNEFPETNNLQKIRHRRHRKQHHQHEENDEEQYKNNEKLNNSNDRMIEEEKEHLKFLQNEHERKKNEIMKQLYEKSKKRNQQDYQKYEKNYNHNSNNGHLLKKRDTVYDAKTKHGGNALNFTDQESDSVSSFENSLLTCYDGQILLAQSFNPSSLCINVHYLANGTHMIARHEVEEDGYYYYIFYSDNDLVRNDIHAVFDIYKPTYQYTNLTDSKGCVNGTNCTFPINFLSDEIVVVEVPTRDGIEHEEDDITYLISTCHPRMSVYIIFPIAVLVLILSCSFL